jgi:hypothetical protein
MNKIISLNDHIITHCNESMQKALSAERHPSWTRACPEMSDIDFTRFGLMRCISTVNSGRHFLQTADNVHGEQLPLSTYFNSLILIRLSRQGEGKCLKRSKSKAINVTPIHSMSARLTT